MNKSSILQRLSVNVCRPTLRGIHNCPVENSWFPLWLIARYEKLEVRDPPDILFFGDIGQGEHLNYPAKTIRVFLTGENIKPNWQEADYAMSHERIWNDRHWRIPLWRHFYDPGYTQVERDFSVVKGRVDSFCNFVYSNHRARERIDFFHRLSRHKPILAGGKVLNNIGGPIKNKIELLRRCKFTIAFENESHSGYATEKIIEPLIAGSIPIYWGDPHIEEDFNPDCLINVHSFRSFDDVVDKILEIDSNQALWEKYVTAPIFRDNTIPDRLSNQAILDFVSKAAALGPQIRPTVRHCQRLKALTSPLLTKLMQDTRSIVRRIIRRVVR